MQVTDAMLHAAMKKAVETGLTPKYAAPEDYLKRWDAMKAILQTTLDLQAASAAPAQEPLAWLLPNGSITESKELADSFDGSIALGPIAAPVASAAPVVPEDQQATFEIIQDGMAVAGVSGPRNDAMREAQHYAAVYGQDGPVEIREKRPRAKKGVLKGMQ